MQSKPLVVGGLAVTFLLAGWLVWLGRGEPTASPALDGPEHAAGVAGAVSGGASSSASGSRRARPSGGSSGGGIGEAAPRSQAPRAGATARRGAPRSGTEAGSLEAARPGGRMRSSAGSEEAPASGRALEEKMRQELDDFLAWDPEQTEEDEVAAARAGLRGGTPEERISAIGDIASLDQNVAVRELEGVLRGGEPNPDVRAEAFNQLVALLEDEGALVSTLIQGLRDPSHLVREQAANDLYYYEDPRIIPALRQAYATEHDADVRDQVASTLEGLDSNFVVPIGTDDADVEDDTVTP